MNDPMKIDTSAWTLAAQASSRADGKERWTTLSVFHSADERRCWLAEARGCSVYPAERDKTRRVASASLERALRLFVESDLGVIVTAGAHEFAEEQGLAKFPGEGAPADDLETIGQLFGKAAGDVPMRAAARAFDMGESSLRMALKNGTPVRVPLRSLFPFIDRAAFQRAQLEEASNG